MKKKKISLKKEIQARLLIEKTASVKTLKSINQKNLR
jgi:hypothetical protein